MSITSQMNLAKILFPAIVTVLLASCAGIEESPSDPDALTVDAFYSKGPVSKAECTLFNSDGVAIAEPKISNNGAVQFQTKAQTKSVYMECNGGSYTDEATGVETQLGDTKMRGSAKVTKDNNKLVVTPLTEIAFELASIDGDLSDYDDHAKDVADEFGLDGIDISKVQPSSIEELKTNGYDISKDDDKYGTVLTVVSQVLKKDKEDGKERKIKEYIEDSFTDISEDGSLDKESEKLKTAIIDLETNTNTQIAFNQGEKETLIQNTGEDDGSDPIFKNTDDDNDGVLNGFDDLPFDSTESVDTDNDGIGNNLDSA